MLYISRDWTRLLDDLPQVYELTGETTKKALSSTVLLANPKGEDRPADDVIDRVADSDRNLIAFTSLFTLSRRFTVTSGGSISLVPNTTTRGDVIVFLVGGSVLYAARPLIDGDDTSGTLAPTKKYRSIGQAYVHGLVNGEVADYRLNLQRMAFFPFNPARTARRGQLRAPNDCRDGFICARC